MHVFIYVRFSDMYVSAIVFGPFMKTLFVIFKFNQFICFAHISSLFTDIPYF